MITLISVMSLTSVSQAQNKEVRDTLIVLLSKDTYKKVREQIDKMSLERKILYKRELSTILEEKRKKK